VEAQYPTLPPFQPPSTPVWVFIVLRCFHHWFLLLHRVLFDRLVNGSIVILFVTRDRSLIEV
jgi:hypothetical protein